MNLYWLEQVQADVPVRNDWLSSWETARANNFRIAKRRADWRLGRWTAKQALAFCLNLNCELPALTAIEIRPASSGVPEVFVNQARAPLEISLSHREGRAMCVIARLGARVGCDLEIIEPRSDAFIADYLTDAEQQMLAGVSREDRQFTVSLLWSAKESALKALHEGLRLDARAVSASFACQSPDTEGWSPLQVRYGYQLFMGRWQETGHLLRTIVADTAFGAPICLPIDKCCAPELAA